MQNTKHGPIPITPTEQKAAASSSHWRALALWLILAAFGAAGCGIASGPAPPPKVFMLAPVSSSAAEDRQPDTADTDAAVPVIVGPVELPAYLDRPNVIKRQGSRIIASESVRWAEPLEQAVERVLALEINKGAAGFRAYPVSFNPPPAEAMSGALNLTVNCYSFEAVNGEEVQLQAEWALTDAGGRRLLAKSEASYHVLLDHGSWEDIITAMEQALARLSADVVRSLKTLHDASRTSAEKSPKE